MGTKNGLSPSSLFLALFLSLTFSQISTLPTGGSHPFCLSRSQVNHAYNFGSDSLYLVKNSHSVFDFNTTEKELNSKRFSLGELFGKDAFQWVDTVISLSGFCQKSPLCIDETWRALERLYIVIGQRRLPTKTYGYALYQADPTSSTQEKRPLTAANVDQALSDKLTKIGLPFAKKDKQEAGLMIGDFWPKFSDKFYYQSGMFFPERGELIFNVYNTQNAQGSKREILRRKFTTTLSNDEGQEAWQSMNLDESESGGSNFDLNGMFRLGGKYFGMDKSKNIVYEFNWVGEKIQLKKVGPITEFVNCFKNSSTVEELKKEESINKADPSENSLKPEPEQPKTSTSKTTPTTTVSKPIEPEAEVFRSPDTNQSGEMREKEDGGNEIDSKSVGNDRKESEDDDDDLVTAQSDDPRTHQMSEASARGPFKDDDGLIWTFSILVGVLILLSLIILIPILIIRHNARSDRMYINKTTKKTTNGNTSQSQSQNSEEVQLMNSSNIEKC